MRKEPITMRLIWSALDAEDKRFICMVLNERRPEGSVDIHPGLLPFVTILTVQHELRHTFRNNLDVGKRSIKKLEAKIVEAIKANHKLRKPKLFMHLDPKKVARQFGAHPERGKQMQFLPKKRVTVGVKWSLPKQMNIPDTNVHVAPTVALIAKTNKLWEVQCEPAYWPRVHAWLLDYCA